MNKIVFDTKYYKKVILDNGYDPVHYELGELNFSLGKLTKEELNTKFLCHSKANKFAQNYKKGANSLVCTGIGLSGVPHVGTLMQIERAIYLQHSGLPVQFILGDLDSQNGKGTSPEYTKELVEKYSIFITELGFKDEKPSILRSQNPYNTLHQKDAFDTLLSMYELGFYMKDEYFEEAKEDLHEFYARHGKVDADPKMSFRRRLSLALMIADFGNQMIRNNTSNIMVTLGIDEHSYVKMAQLVIDGLINDHSNYSNLHLAGIYTPMISGLFGASKMSKSIPNSGIYADMNEEQIRNCVLEGEYPRKNGSDPRSNPVYQMISNITDFDTSEMYSIFESCKSHNKKWVECKENLAEILIDKFKRWPK